MGLFNFFNTKRPEVNQNNVTTIQPEIPKDLFIEELDPQENTNSNEARIEVNGIDTIYNFLQGDYESKGYSDALTNPDESYKTDNIKLIRLDLQILIQKVNTYYEDIRTELGLHITTRSRSGLMDLVQELETRKVMVDEHMVTVKQINDDIDNESGLSHRIILSYQRGFMRGLSALTQSQILNRKL